ncbi:MAG: CDP-alcohol phosphatidyltransferase family protein [Pirellulales bacterium]|nr:CDP-alcohol phosphatidyltransferase family protein [Pirellulales bacterium]
MIDAQRRWWTVPNVLSAIRLAGAPVVVGLALAGGGPYLLPLIVVLLVTDWIDGKLAIALRQQTALGARLDSLADVTFYASVLFALVYLQTDLVLGEAAWIVPAAIGYAVSCVAGLVKFGRIPTYHTRGAKIGWLLASLAILLVFAAGAAWPLRVAGVWTLLVNLEALAITLVLPEAAVDVPSVLQALARRQARSQDEFAETRGRC